MCNMLYLFGQCAWVGMHLLVCCVAALAPREGQLSIVTMVEMMCLQGNYKSMSLEDQSESVGCQPGSMWRFMACPR